MLSQTTTISLTEAGALLGALSALLLSVLTLWFTKGSKARIAEMNARAKLEAANVQELTISYETMIGDIKSEHEAKILAIKAEHDGFIAKLEKDHEVRMATAQALLERMDIKLEKCEESHKSVLKEANYLKGCLDTVTKRVDNLENRP